MNTYKKYCPNVFVALCDDKHNKGDEIILTTKRGKENKHIVHNYLGELNDKHLYSITRADGMTYQDFVQRKADRINGFKSNAEKRSHEYYDKSNKHRDFLALGEPIKVGHHSEKRHRKLFEDNWNNMSKSVEEQDKADEYARRAEYWEAKANDVNLSMPESLEYYEFELEKAKKKHKFLKDNPDKRSHSYSLTYAKKDVNKMEDNVRTAIKLWGTDEEIEQMNSERVQESKKKTGNKTDELIKKYGGFFAFNKDQFKEGYSNLVTNGYIEEGDKVKHVIAGLYVPSSNVNQFIKEM